MKNNSGFCLLELITAMFIFSIIALAASKLFIIQISLSKKVQRMTTLKSKASYLNSLMEMYVRQANSLHSIETIKFTEDIPTTSNNLTKKPLTQALSFLVIDLNTFYSAIKDSKGKFCKFQKPLTKPRFTKNRYLVFTIDGYFLATGITKNIKSHSSSCNGSPEVKFSITPLTSTFNYSNMLDTEKSLFIIPLVDSFSIYQSTKNEIRYFSEISRENQPLVDQISDFTLIQKSLDETIEIQLFLKSTNTFGESYEQQFLYYKRPQAQNYLDVIF